MNILKWINQIVKKEQQLIFVNIDYFMYKNMYDYYMYAVIQ